MLLQGTGPQAGPFYIGRLSGQFRRPAGPPGRCPLRPSGDDMEHSRKYRTIAYKLLRTLDEFAELKESGVRIAYLTSDEPKKKDHKIIFAECCKVDKKYFWCCPYDFFIVVYEPHVIDFTEKQLEILIRHELHHVGIDYSGEQIKFYIVPHDVEEFWDIIREHGLHWSEINGQEGRQSKDS